MAGLAGGGDSGSKSAIEAGNAVVRATVDDRQVKQKLGTLQERFKAFAKDIKEYLPEGQTGQLFGLGARAGLIGAGLLLLAKPLTNLKDALTTSDAVAKSIEKAALKADSLANSAAAAAKNAREWLATTDLAGQRNLLQGAINTNQGSIQELIKLRDQFQKIATENTTGHRWIASNFLPFTDQIKEDADSAKQAVADLNKQIKALGISQAELRQQRDRLKNPLLDPNYYAQLKTLNDDLGNAAGNFGLEGFSKRVADLDKLFNRPGNPVLQKMFAKLKIDAATADLEEYVRVQDKARLATVMTADELRLLQAKLAGVSSAQLKEAERSLNAVIATRSGLLSKVVGTLTSRLVNLAPLAKMGDLAMGTFSTGGYARQSFGPDYGIKRGESILSKIEVNTAQTVQQLKSRHPKTWED